MMRWLLAVAFLLGGLVTLSRADYVIIIANLGLVKEKEDTQKKGQQQPGVGNRFGGMMGGGPGAGGPGMRGGGPGAAGPGRPGAGGGAGGRGVPQQPGAGGAPRPGGGGVMGPPPGVGGMPPGMGMMGGMPGMGMMGGQGAAGGGGPPPGVGGMPPGMGMMGGMPGMPGMGMGGGARGGMGMQGMMMGFGLGNTTAAQTESAPFYVMTVVETKESLTPKQISALKANRPVIINHKWGSTVLQPGLGLDVIVMTSDNKPYPSVDKRYHQRLEQAHKDSGSLSPEQQIALLLDYSSDPQAGPAKFALEHSMLKQFREVMEEVKKLDPKHPKVKALDLVEKAMAQKISKPDSSGTWKQRLGLKESKESAEGHYVLLYNGTSDGDMKEVQSRLKSLEDTHKMFFYWFAFNCDQDGNLAYIPKGQNNALIVPDERLVAVLANDEKQFNHFHKIYNNVLLAADGFTARRDNIAIFSRERLDKQFKALNDYCSPKFLTFGKDELLHRKRSVKARDRGTEEWQEAQTLALMVRSLEADSELATVSHEGPKQLIAAIGLLPRSVFAPDWIQFGMGSCFETAKGAPWGGAGGANWIYLQDYKDRAAKLKLGPNAQVNKGGAKPLEALKGVVTDRYFRESNNGRNEGNLMKARTTAWSLVYFLIHRKLNGLMPYYRELARMPRDMEFDDESLLLTFARAFDCLDAKGEKPDEAKLKQLAEEWHRFLDLTPLEGEEVVKNIRERQSELKAGGVGKPGEATKKDEEKKPAEEKNP
jgi:hypothetical protein